MTPPLSPVVDPQVPDTSRSRSDSMCGLASLLLDWRVDCERHLRALTSIQRWLEQVRGGEAAGGGRGLGGWGAAADGDRELLIQEMGRLLQQPPPDHDEWTRRAETYLVNLSR